MFEGYLEDKAHVIRNTAKHRKGHVIDHTRDVKASRRYMMDLLKEGKRVVCPCNSKKLAGEIHAQAQALFGNEKRVLLYTSDSPWKGGDVNKVWLKADLVIYTSTIDCGVSFEVAEHFHHCIAFLNNRYAAMFIMSSL